MRQGAENRIEHNSRMVQKFLKLSGSFIALAQLQIGLAAFIRAQKSSRIGQVIKSDRLEDFNRFAGIVEIQLDRGADGWNPIPIRETVGGAFLGHLDDQ